MSGREFSWCSGTVTRVRAGILMVFRYRNPCQGRNSHGFHWLEPEPRQELSWVSSTVTRARAGILMVFRYRNPGQGGNSFQVYSPDQGENSHGSWYMIPVRAQGEEIRVRIHTVFKYIHNLNQEEHSHGFQVHNTGQGGNPFQVYNPG